MIGWIGRRPVSCAGAGAGTCNCALWVVVVRSVVAGARTCKGALWEVVAGRSGILTTVGIVAFSLVRRWAESGSAARYAVRDGQRE
jgi:hypothetical protein